MASYYPLDPPYRFALLASSSTSDLPQCSLYRGSLPKPHNLSFLTQLHLKTIVSMTPKPLQTYVDDGDLPPRKRRRIGGRIYSEDEEPLEERVTDWIQRTGVNVLHYKVGKAKDGAIPFPTATVKAVLEILLSRENYPIYIHDLDGSDVISILIAVLRKLQGWSERAWIEEMSRHLRAPPPEPEHLTFIRRVFSATAPSQASAQSSANSSSETEILVVPPHKVRVPWLWPQGLPTTTTGKRRGEHVSMRIQVQIDPQEVEAERLRERLRIEEDLRSGGSNMTSGGTTTTKRSARDKSESRPPPLHRDQALSLPRKDDSSGPVAGGTGSRSSSSSMARVSSGNLSVRSNGSEATLVPPKHESVELLNPSTGDAATRLVVGPVIGPRQGEEDEHDEEPHDEEDGEEYEREDGEDEEDEDHDEDDDDDEDDEDEGVVLSQTIDALDLGL